MALFPLRIFKHCTLRLRPSAADSGLQNPQIYGGKQTWARLRRQLDQTSPCSFVARASGVHQMLPVNQRVAALWSLSAATWNDNECDVKLSVSPRRLDAGSDQ